MKDSSVSLQDRLAGSRLAHYDIQRLLGRGGMGEVFEATDLRLRRVVAVKVVQQSGRAETVDRFLQEARFAAQLNHPNVVTIYEVNRADDLIYIAMEFMDAGSMQQLLDESGACSWEVATRVVIKVARGLEAAHQRGLIHRDIKPGNILRNRRGDIKLTDFGLAKSDGAAALAHTAPGVALGTPLFMSPEQCQGESIDARSDIYSLGATYFALLTGRPPFERADSLQVAFAHCGSPIPDPRAMRSEVPESVARIIQRAMAKRPSDRYQTISELLADLKAALTSTEPTSTAPKSGNSVALRTAKGSPFTVRTAALTAARGKAIRVTAAAIACLLFVVWWMQPEATPVATSRDELGVQRPIVPDSAKPERLPLDESPRGRLQRLVAPPAAGEIERLVRQWRDERHDVAGWRVERTSRGPTGFQIQVVSHLIDGQRHYAMLHMATPSDPPRALPVLLVVPGDRQRFDVQQILGWRRSLPGLDEFLVVIPALRGQELGGWASLGRHVSEGQPAGLNQDARDALACLTAVLKSLPEAADPQRLAVFGSGAGTSLALQIAARDSRIRAVLAVSDSTGFLLSAPSVEELADASAKAAAPSSNLGPIADEIVKPFLSGQLSMDEARAQWLGWSPESFAAFLPHTQLHVGGLPDKPWIDGGQRLEQRMRVLSRTGAAFECFRYENDPTSRDALRQFRSPTVRLLEEIRKEGP